MTFRALALSALVCAMLVVGVAAFTELSLGRALMLAPVLVLSVGAIAFLFVLWGRVAYESLKGRRDEG